MAQVIRRKKRKDEIKVTVAPLRNLADYKSCEDIQREVWRLPDIDIVPGRLLLSASRAGGILLGAYSNLGDLIGFAFSFPGMEEGRLVQHSYALAVRMAYRNFDVGFKLKMVQRKEALKRKISLITASFDPMQPLNAYFALGKLGQLAVGYEENLLGAVAGRADRALPTDRIVTRWNLDSSAVVRRLEAGPPPRDYRRDLKQRPLINHLSEAAPGLAASSAVKLNCNEEQFLFELPANLPEFRHRNLGLALEWQGKMRQVFRHYFKRGYAASDFWLLEQDGHLRSFYFFEKRKL